MLNKKKKNSKEKKPEINQNDIIAEVVVFRETEGGAKEIANFYATQKGEDGLNLVLVNDDANFKETISNVEDEVFSSIRTRLKLEGLSKEGKTKIIEDRIKVQNSIISEMNDKNYKKVEELKLGVGELTEGEVQKYEAKGLKRKYNTIDESVKLKQLTDLLYVVEHDGKGFVEFTNIRNQRKFFFTYLDGHLFPIKYVNAEQTMHVGKTKKVKNYRSEQSLIDAKRDKKLNGFTNWAKIALNALLVVMIIINIFWSQQNFRDNKNIETLKSDAINAEREFWRNKCSNDSIDLEKECKLFTEAKEKQMQVNQLKQVATT